MAPGGSELMSKRVSWPCWLGGTPTEDEHPSSPPSLTYSDFEVTSPPWFRVQGLGIRGPKP